MACRVPKRETMLRSIWYSASLHESLYAVNFVEENRIGCGDR